ncbi:MAG: copper-binding protein [Rhodospirillaceae bacterium]|nr:copper-binding protein [Rhodospirillaceae bacterium]
MGSKILILFIFFTILTTGSLVKVPILLAAGSHDKGHARNVNLYIGKPGKAVDATRTIEIVMFDNRYEPNTLEIKEGETVRFVVRNAGELVHEFSIATAEMHLAHQPEMVMMVEHGVLEADRINWDAAKRMRATKGHGMHEEPNSILLEPGKSGEIVWTFPKHADLEFACNVPGHYEAGMRGSVELTH